MSSINTFSSRRAPASIFIGLLLALSACQSSKSADSSADKAEPKRVELTSQIATTAEVVKVDASTRLVTVRREDGSMLSIEAGPAVRNFDQIAIGDKLRVVYRDTLAASMRPAGEPATPAEGLVTGRRAELGARPAAGLGVAFSVRVKIESIDRDHEIVVFSLASGELIARRLATAEGREFVADLKVGDTVQLDYTTALAVSIDKL